MSKFLGFIHHLMFGKIKFQESLVNEVIKLSADDEIEKRVDELGTIEAGNLEDIIDESNIHGWLQERVVLVENRFAKAVNLVMDKNPDMKEKLINEFYNFGQSENFSGNALEAYQLITQRFLDGMPCDGSLMQVINEPEHVKVKVVTDLHTPVWNKYGNEELYWQLRNSYIKGLLSSSKLELNIEEDKTFEIK